MYRRWKETVVQTRSASLGLQSYVHMYVQTVLESDVP